MAVDASVGRVRPAAPFVPSFSRRARPGTAHPDPNAASPTQLHTGLIGSPVPLKLGPIWPEVAWRWGRASNSA